RAAGRIRPLQRGRRPPHLGGRGRAVSRRVRAPPAGRVRVRVGPFRCRIHSDLPANPAVLVTIRHQRTGCRYEPLLRVEGSNPALFPLRAVPPSRTLLPRTAPHARLTSVELVELAGPTPYRPRSVS